ETHAFQEKEEDKQETLLQRIYQLIRKLQEDHIQKIQQKLSLYIKDFQKPITSAGLQDMVEVFGHSWEDKKLALEKDLKVLARMYDSDFEVLKQEAYHAYLEEASDSTIPDEF
ncbi:27319_t:CDS:2, partial [Dentiscutata erythropus]